MALVDSLSESFNNTTNDLYTGTSYTGMSQAFTGSNGSITLVKFFLKKTGSPTGTAVAKLYTNSGTFGTSSVPGTLLATSDTFDVSTLTTSLALTSLTFSGANQYTMTSGTNYVISFEWTGGNNTNYVTFAYNAIAGGTNHPGNLAKNFGGWSASSNSDACFYVYDNILTTTNLFFF